MVASMDLAAAMVMHAAFAAVETVIVNGEIVKKEGVLKRVNWNELNKKFVKNRLGLEERYKHVD